ncbi:MAG: hypothetical protein H7287_11060 [Thermoleophilia bacterium]|nr:hypothetical protein [Thermoleophilia bacterium]
MIKPLPLALLATSALTAAVAIPYNVDAVVHDAEFRSLAAFATDLVVGAGAAGVAGLAGLAAFAPAARPVAGVVAGIGLGVVAGAALGAGALVLTARLTPHPAP